MRSNVRPTTAHHPVQRKQGVQVLSGRLQSQWQAKAVFFKDEAAAAGKLAELGPGELSPGFGLV